MKLITPYGEYKIEIPKEEALENNDWETLMEMIWNQSILKKILKNM